MKYKYVCFILVAQRRVLYWVLLLLPNTLFLCTQCGVTLHMFIYRAIEWKRAESGFMPRYLFLLLPSEFDWLLRPVIDVLANQYILGSTPKKAFHNIQSAKEKPVITANFAFSITNWLQRIIQKKMLKLHANQSWQMCIHNQLVVVVARALARFSICLE